MSGIKHARSDLDPEFGEEVILLYMGLRARVLVENIAACFRGIGWCIDYAEISLVQFNPTPQT